MKKLFPQRRYLSCPDCRQRMKRVGYSGTDIYSYVIDYECPCGACWSYIPYGNIMERGWSQDYPASKEAKHE